MKHLVEAERESSVPSSNPKKWKNFGRLLGCAAAGRLSPFEMILDTNSVCLETHRIVQITLLGDRTRALTPGAEIRGWRGAVTSSSDQTRAETRKFPVDAKQVKLACMLCINKSHTSRAVGSGALRGKEKHISLRQRVFIRGTACSLDIYLKPQDRGVWCKMSPN